jgi:type VI secretion system protein ImpK
MRPLSVKLPEPPADDRTLMPEADATIRMPAPGGQATMVLPRPAAARNKRPDVELQRLVAGLNPLLGAASVLLALVAQLRSTTAHADPAGLRSQLLERVAEFEARAAAHGVPKPQIGAARYVLCSFVDEAIASTPWGAGGVWAERNLLQEFHDERSGGHKAFELIERLCEDPAANADLLELFYVCLALGFEGRWRGVPNGRAQLDAAAARLLALVRPAAEAADTRTLSLRWQGVAGLGRRTLAVLPLWVVFALGAALLIALLLLLHARLDDLARPVFHRIHALPQALQIERTSVPAKDRVAPLLRAEAAAGALAVRDEALRSVVTLPADALFERASARVDAKQVALVGRIAQALKGLPGQVVVVGHSDDAPTGSLQYPSNWALSRERAQAVAALLAQHGLTGDRVHAEGRADAEPLVPNATPADRARNRRIEIELRLPRPDA